MGKRKEPPYKMSNSPVQTERIDDGFRQLKLGGMQTIYKELAQQVIKIRQTPYDLIENLIDQEMAWQNTNKAKRRESQANFPEKKTLEDFDFSFQPTINPQEIWEFASCRFIENAENIMFLGPEGVGKTHLSIALGRKAIDNGCTVRFTTLDDLMTKIKKSQDELQRQRIYSLLFNADLLILDEMDFYETDDITATFLFRLVQQRYERKSIIFTSQKAFDEWGKVFGNNTRTSAILGRINYHGHVISINGPSYRMKNKIKNPATEKTK